MIFGFALLAHAMPPRPRAFSDPGDGAGGSGAGGSGGGGAGPSRTNELSVDEYCAWLALFRRNAIVARIAAGEEAGEEDGGAAGPSGAGGGGAGPSDPFEVESLRAALAAANARVQELEARLQADEDDPDTAYHVARMRLFQRRLIEQQHLAAEKKRRATE